MGASHGGAEPTASGLAAGGGGRLGWAFMHPAWAGPSPELSSPLESNRKVPGKQPQGAARPRLEQTRPIARASQSPAPRTGGQAGRRTGGGRRAGRRGRGTRDRDPVTSKRTGWSSHRSDALGS